jgi:hypothetical protein
MLKVFTLLVFLLTGTSLFCQNSETIITEYSTNIGVKMNEPFVIKTLNCGSCPSYWYPDSFDTTIIKLHLDTVGLYNIKRPRHGLIYDRWNIAINKVGQYVINFYHKSKEVGYKEELKPWIVEIDVK